MSWPPRAPPLPESLMQAVAGTPDPASAPPKPRQEGGGRADWPRPINPSGPRPTPAPDPGGTRVGEALPSELGGAPGDFPLQGHQGPGPEASDRKGSLASRA